MDLTQFYVTSIEVDSSSESGRRVLDAISRQSAQSIAGYTWQQGQAFEVAKGAVDGIGDSNGGLLGALIATNMIGNVSGGGALLQPQYQQPTFGGQTTPVAQGNIPQAPAVKDVYCSNCSRKFPNTHRFCPHCGDAYDACPKCGADNDRQAKRCVSCGTGLQPETSSCIHCNQPLAPGSAFCGGCGQQQPGDKCQQCSNPLPPSVKFCPRCGKKR